MIELCKTRHSQTVRSLQDLLVDNSRQIPQTVSFELLRVFSRRHRGHHELEVGGARGLQHEDHEDPLTGGTRSVLLPVKAAPHIESQDLLVGDVVHLNHFEETRIIFFLSLSESVASSSQLV